MPLAGGSFNAGSHVRDASRRMRGQAAQGTFQLYPDANAPSGNRGQRSHALGSFQSGDPVMGRQYYDVRYNLHICKELILMWGRNAYSSDAAKGGAPITVSHGGTHYDVHCHIDITTPRENYLWHGVEGPHVVVEYYCEQGSDQVQRLEDNSIWLSPNDVFKLYVWERDNNSAARNGHGPRTWPEWLKQRFVDRIVTKLAAIARRQQRDAESDEDGMEGGWGGLFG